MGVNPNSGVHTNALLGPYLKDVWSYQCDVTSSMAGPQLLWSALWVRWAGAGGEGVARGGPGDGGGVVMAFAQQDPEAQQ